MCLTVVIIISLLRSSISGGDIADHIIPKEWNVCRDELALLFKLRRSGIVFKVETVLSRVGAKTLSLVAKSNYDKRIGNPSIPPKAELRVTTQFFLEKQNSPLPKIRVHSSPMSVLHRERFPRCSIETAHGRFGPLNDSAVSQFEI